MPWSAKYPRSAATKTGPTASVLTMPILTGSAARAAPARTRAARAAIRHGMGLRISYRSAFGCMVSRVDGSRQMAMLRRATGETTMKLQLSIALTTNPRTWPIHDGRVKPDGIDLVITPLHPSEMFWRQLHFAEF